MKKLKMTRSEFLERTARVQELEKKLDDVGLDGFELMNLKELCEKRGIKKSDLRFGLSSQHATIDNYWINTGKMLDKRILLLLSAFIGIPVSELFNTDPIKKTLEDTKDEN